MDGLGGHEYEPVLDVTGWVSDVGDPRGAREKSWLLKPGRGVTDSQHLFKQARPHGKTPEHGSDLWAEVLASRIARAIQVPAVHMDFAVRGSTRGVISQRMSIDLTDGNELLGGDRVADRGSESGYHLVAIRRALAGYQGSERGLTAYESFVGYLILDALIANTDRHSENWAVDLSRGELLPCFDHGASLGFNATEQQRANVSRFASRGRSSPFGVSILEVAQRGLDSVTADVADLWLGRVEALTLPALERLVERVPLGWMSDPSRTFVVGLVWENRRRLLG